MVSGKSLDQVITVKHYTFVDYATQGYTAYVALLVLLFHNHTVPSWWAFVGIHLLILTGIHLLILKNSSPEKNQVLDFLRHFYPVLLYTWFFCQTGSLNRMFFKEFMDPTLIRWEQALFGFQPAVLFMAKLPYLWVSEIFYASYFSYYIMITGVGIALYFRERRHFYHYVSVVSFVFYLCYATYIVLPIIGPRVFFHELGGFSLPEDLRMLAPTEVYPEAVKSGVFFKLMAFIYRTFEAPGAAFPSSHVAIAITTLFFSFRYLPRIRFIHLVVVVLLCLSTVYCRYHYVIDVAAGALTAAVLVPIANWLYARTAPPPAAKGLADEPIGHGAGASS